MLQRRNLSRLHRDLIIGLVAGIVGSILLLLVIFWLRRIRSSRAIRDIGYELDDGSRDSGVRFGQQAVRMTGSRLFDSLRSGAQHTTPPIMRSVETQTTQDTPRTRGQSGIVLQTQFDIEIGKAARVKRHRLKRLRSRQESEEDVQRVCRRKLSKKSFKPVDRADPAPTRLMVDEPLDCDEQQFTDASKLVPRSSGGIRSSSFQQVLVSPDRYTRSPAIRTQSESMVPTMRTTIVTGNGSIAAKPRPSLGDRAMTCNPGALGPAPQGPLPAVPRAAMLSPERGATRTVIEPASSPGGLSPAADPRSSRSASQAISIASTLSRWGNSGFIVDTPANNHSAVHSQSASVNTWRSSMSPQAFARAADPDNLIVPPLRISDAVRIRQSEEIDRDTVQRSQSTKTVHSPPFEISPRRTHSGTRVSFTGSPAPRRQYEGPLQEITPNIVSEPDSAKRRSKTEEFVQQWSGETVLRKASAMKGSPRARKGHRRQNCVRISTLPPSVLGYEKSRNSLLGIVEESPNSITASRPIHLLAKKPDFHPTRASTIGSRRSHDPKKWRASLTQSSPSLQMTRFDQEQPQRSSRVPEITRSEHGLAREPSCILSIPSLPSVDRFLEFQEELTTPTFELTRPSGEYDDGRNSFPFNFESPVQPARYDDTDMTWSPAPVGLQDMYDPSLEKLSEQTPGGWPHISPNPSEVSLGLSSATSSMLFPNDDDDATGLCSDPLDIASAVPSPLASHPKRSRLDIQIPRKADVVAALKSTARRPSQAYASPSSSPVQIGSAKSQRISIVRASPLNHTTSSPLTRSAQTTGRPSSTLVTEAHRMDQTTSRDFENITNNPSSTKGTLTPPQKRKSSQANGPSGPRNHPTQGLLRSIAKLRRMNSDLQSPSNNTWSSRRYAKFGREASPVLPFSFSSFPVFDSDGFETSLLEQEGVFDVHVDEDEQQDVDQDPDPEMDGLEIDEAALDLAFQQSMAQPIGHNYGFDLDFGFDCPPPLAMPPFTQNLPLQPSPSAGNRLSQYASSGIRRRSKTVWDDGQDYWDTIDIDENIDPVSSEDIGCQIRFTENEVRALMGMSPVSIRVDSGKEVDVVTPRNWAFVDVGGEGGVAIPGLGGLESGNEKRGFGAMKTPGGRSLYDADGFLRT